MCPEGNEVKWCNDYFYLVLSLSQPRICKRRGTLFRIFWLLFFVEVQPAKHHEVPFLSQNLGIPIECTLNAHWMPIEYSLNVPIDWHDLNNVYLCLTKIEQGLLEHHELFKRSLLREDIKRIQNYLTLLLWVINWTNQHLFEVQCWGWKDLRVTIGYPETVNQPFSLILGLRELNSIPLS